MSELRKLISRDPYLKEWRSEISQKLILLGLSEASICMAITGNLDKKSDIYTCCKQQKVDPKEVMKILNIK